MAAAAPGGQPAQQSYKGAQFVQVMLGQPDVEQGLRLVDGQPDGLTQPSLELGGRQSLPNQLGSERYFYFDVHDTYIHGGQNRVQMTVTYKDLGLSPIYLEYDALDPLRPQSKAPEVVRKRIPVATRTNSEATKTAFITLDDARLEGNQPGGADFRISAIDDLVLTNVSVRLSAHAEAPTPIRVVLNGKPITFDPDEVQPFAHPQTGRTLVPLRAILGALGIANADIVWDDLTKTVQARKGDKTIALTIDNVTVKVNGQVQAEKLDQPATIVAGRTVVPLRFVATQFGLDVKWDPVTRTVTLTTLPPTPPTKP
jgi:hypothetical protein